MMSTATRWFVSLLVVIVGVVVVLTGWAAAAGPLEPQKDPRSGGWSGDTRQRFVFGENGSTYYAEACEFGNDATDSVVGVCVYGPITLDDLHATGFDGHGFEPIAEMVAGRDGAHYSIVDITLSPAEDGILVAVSLAFDKDPESGTDLGYSVQVVEVGYEGAVTYHDTVTRPCDGSPVFDAAGPLLWYPCGPTSVDYTNGSVVDLGTDFEFVVPDPAGAVLAFTNDPTPTLGIVNTTTVGIFDLGLPSGAEVVDADGVDGTGLVALVQTPCLGECEYAPDPIVLPDQPEVCLNHPLYDFSVVHVPLDGGTATATATEIAAVGTGREITARGADHIASDGELTVIRQRALGAGDRCEQFYEPAGMVRTSDRATAEFHLQDTFTQQLEIGWGGFLQLSSDDGLSSMAFWHVTDQGRFFDDILYEADIEALAAAGITQGCNAEGNLFCPEDELTRGQMASLIARWRGLPLDAPDVFADDDGSVHEAAINAVAAAGITVGCDAGDSDLFCPGDLVTRAQMATMLQRTLGLSDAALDRFSDDDGSVHESAINAIAAAGIANGCGETAFCPHRPVLRMHAAAFLNRAGV